MATIAKAGRGDPVIQFSIFSENKALRLVDLVRLLNSNNVHAMALTILDATDSSIIRVVVDDPRKTRHLLRNHRFSFAECEVLAVEIASAADVNKALLALLMAEVNIHYIYSFVSRPNEKCALAINIDDIDIAEQCLISHQFKVLRQDDISR